MKGLTTLLFLGQSEWCKASAGTSNRECYRYPRFRFVNVPAHLTTHLYLVSSQSRIPSFPTSSIRMRPIDIQLRPKPPPHDDTHY